MLRVAELRLPIEHSPREMRAAIVRELGIRDQELVRWEVARRSVDARKRGAIAFIYNLDVETPREQEILARPRRPRGGLHVGPVPDTTYRPPAAAPAGLRQRPLVVGAGPCGLFAALLLAEMGFRPLLLERGKPVRERTVDTFGLWRRRRLDPESNVQFGEGGAGTFSDGKLHSQIRDPERLGRKVLAELVAAGAPAEILYVHRPHIGTFRLVKIVEGLRGKIEGLGGEIRFRSRVEELLVEDGAVAGVRLADGTAIDAAHVVLALGHSARDTFQMLWRRGVALEAKPFSLGFRIEHPQGLVDRCRYGPQAGHPLLGAAEYKLVHHCANGRSVYSFCMCPGGTVVAAASEPGRVVTNGMSQWSRDERNANSGIVVGITPEDYPGGPLAGIALQRHWEERAFAQGGGAYDAPGQLVGDFLAGRPSTAFGAVQPSYRPGVHPADLGDSLPAYAIAAIREALPHFDAKLPGFAMPDAVLTAVETRTSSPVRIRRGADLQSVNTRGLYPGGEGAGYAGGILSAAVDGIRVAEAVALAMTHAIPFPEERALSALPTEPAGAARPGAGSAAGAAGALGTPRA